jgi:hypothetical protein
MNKKADLPTDQPIRPKRCTNHQKPSRKIRLVKVPGGIPKDIDVKDRAEMMARLLE